MHITRTVGRSVLAVSLGASLWLYTPGAPAQQQEDPGCAFIRAALEAQQAIHVGDTRAKLDKTFELGGGMSMNDQSRYVYRKCQYLYVDVTFHLLHARNQASSPGDTIASISNLTVDAPVVN